MTRGELRGFSSALVALVLAGVVGGGASRAAAERPSLSLFQMIARSDLVVHVRTREGALKYALVEVLETLKGDPPSSVLRIAFREFNWSRPAGQDPIVLPDGQEEILFLVQDPRAARKEKYADLFSLFRGVKGRITVPAEGAEIPLEAIRQLVGLTNADPATQAGGLLELLTSRNPYLSEAALAEVARLRAATSATLPDLTALLRRPAPQVRRGSLRIIAQVFGASTAGTAGGAGSPDMTRAALEAVLERARNDPEEQVRVEAVTTIAAWPRFADVEGELRAIASLDPGQMVRYEAERTLFRKSLETASGAGPQ